MENFDMIIFSVILVLLFVVFLIGTIAQFSRMSNENFNAETEKGGVETLKNFFGRFMGD